MRENENGSTNKHTRCSEQRLFSCWNRGQLWQGWIAEGQCWKAHVMPGRRGSWISMAWHHAFPWFVGGSVSFRKLCFWPGSWQLHYTMTVTMATKGEAANSTGRSCCCCPRAHMCGYVGAWVHRCVGRHPNRGPACLCSLGGMDIPDTILWASLALEKSTDVNVVFCTSLVWASATSCLLWKWGWVLDREGVGILGILAALCAHASHEGEEQKPALSNSKRSGLPRRGSPPFLQGISPAVHRACEEVERISWSHWGSRGLLALCR